MKLKLTKTDNHLNIYLRQLADKDWGMPVGFGGGTCFKAIPPLELEKRGESTGYFRWEWIDYSLDLLRQRKDCQDFSMVGLLRMLYRYPQSPLLKDEYRGEIAKVMLAAKYDMKDGGDDTCCWHTENHQIQYASSELLIGQLFPETIFSVTGKTGGWHMERARKKINAWLNWRSRFSFSEWNSSCYYDDDAAALLNLAEYAEDAELRGNARNIFDMLAMHVALNSWHGLTAGSQGRAYLEQQITPRETPMATLAQVCWGEEEVPVRLSHTAILLAAGEIRIPPEIIAIGKDKNSVIANRERHSLDADTAALYGVYPDNFADYPFFQAAGQDHHHLVTDMRYFYHDGIEKWPGFFADRDYYQKCEKENIAFYNWQLPHALGSANLYSYKTPDYFLGCAQNYHPGAPGYQQFIWSATLGERAVVFTTNPAPADIPYGRPGPWVGNGVLPKVVQHRNVLIAMHKVRPCHIYDQPPWWREDRVHAWFPKAAFDEVIEQNGWYIGRKDNGYIALRPNKPAAWLAPEPALAARLKSDEPYEINVDDIDVVWICEMGSRRENGEFQSFVNNISSSSFEGDIESFRYHSPSLGVIENGWNKAFNIGGEQINIDNYPLFDNKYLTAPFGVPIIINYKENL